MRQIFLCTLFLIVLFGGLVYFLVKKITPGPKLVVVIMVISALFFIICFSLSLYLLTGEF